MADTGTPPRAVPDDRGRQRQLAALTAAAVAATLMPRHPLLLWNASASAPMGLYLITPGVRISIGDHVAAWPRPAARQLASARGYLPASVPLVKRIAATSGSKVCAAGALMRVDGRVIAVRRTHDSRGRPLPRWTGCRTLAHGEFLLLGRGASSFDGRYFGPSGPRDLIGSATLLWPR